MICRWCIDNKLGVTESPSRIYSVKSISTTLASFVLSRCAIPLFDVGNTETVLPLSKAWVDGQIVEYITTDISEPNMATMMGANHVPRLKDAPGNQSRKSLVERVYKFVNNEQISIFQSSPSPTGPENRDKAYSPLWRVAEARWLVDPGTRVLKSEEELLAAKDRGHVTILDPDVVVNCPITRRVDKKALRGVR